MIDNRLRPGLTMLARGEEWQPLSRLQTKLRGGSLELIDQAQDAGLVEIRRKHRTPGTRGPVAHEVRITRRGMALLGGRLEDLEDLAS